MAFFQKQDEGDTPLPKHAVEMPRYLVDTLVMVYVSPPVQLDHIAELQDDLFSVDRRFTTQMPAFSIRTLLRH